MSTVELSAPGRQALIALLLIAEDATNPMLIERFRLEIKKTERDALVGAKLITIPGKVGNANVHRLTKEGRDSGRRELAKSAPGGTGYGVHLLYAVANILDRVMEQYGLDLDKVLHGDTQAPTPVTTSPQDVEGQILTAYSDLAKRHGDLVSLVRLRSRLAAVDRAALDQTLKTMDRSRLIQLEPDPNRKALPPEAHEAAIRIGGEDKHFITVGHR
jgi:hypothetical protein